MEYILIFAVVAVLSVTVLLPRIQGMFKKYADNATGVMQ